MYYKTIVECRKYELLLVRGNYVPQEKSTVKTSSINTDVELYSVFDLYARKEVLLELSTEELASITNSFRVQSILFVEEQTLTKEPSIGDLL